MAKLGSIYLDISHYTDQSPVAIKVKEVGHFSLERDKETGQNEVLFNNSNLRYLNLGLLEEQREKGKDFSIDLNVGFEAQISLTITDGDTVIPHLFQWIKHRAEENGNHNLRQAVQGARFVGRRGAFRCVASALYRYDWGGKDNAGFKIAIVRFNDVIFLSEYRTHELERKLRKKEAFLRAEYYGRKFSQCMSVTSRLQSKPDLDSTVDHNSEFFSVARANLGPYWQLLYSGAVDAIDPATNKYVDFFTQSIQQNESAKEYYYKDKSLRKYLQETLIGAEKVYMGMKDESGICHKVKEVNVCDLANVAKLREDWDGEACKSFLQATLGFIKKRVVRNNPNHLYLLEQKHKFLTLTKVDPNDEHDYRFIPEWFIDYFGE